MFDPKFFDDIAKRLYDAIPESIRHAPKDLEKNFRSILQTAFANLDLVTREEFDAQVRVLQRTRSKVEILEKQISTLEIDFNAKQPDVTKIVLPPDVIE